MIYGFYCFQSYKIIFRTAGCFLGSFILRKMSPKSFFGISVVLMLIAMIGLFIFHEKAIIYACIALIGFGHRFSIENGGTESSCKRIACAHCVGNRYFGRLLERDNARCEHIAAIDAASENQHLQVVFCQQNPAFILQINAGITKHTADSHQLFVV